MKKFKKVQLIAKNLPTGSYAAGCPTSVGTGQWSVCHGCEVAM